MRASWALSFVIACPTASAAAADSAERELERVAASYWRQGAVAERLEYTVHLPDGRRDRKSMEYGRDGERVFMALYDDQGSRMFHVTAADGVLRVSQFNVGGAYIEAPYGGSLSQALSAAGGDQVGVSVPPGLAAFEPDEDAFLRSFGFNVLPGLEPASASVRDGVRRIGLEAGSGSVELHADAGSGRLIALSLELGEAGSSVRVEGSFEPIEVPGEDPRWQLETAGRRPVADFAALESSVFPLGQPAADLEIRNLRGEVVSLASLEGRVVVLDFWATWCVPCWRSLEQLQELVTWAADSGLPVSVFAVDTLEQASSFEEQSARASEFLAGRGLELPVLVDVDDSFFAGMHSPGLPSTVVIGPDGRLARYHSGVADDMAASLEAEVRALLQP